MTPQSPPENIIRASVNYVGRTDPPPRVYYVDPPQGEPYSTVQIDTRQVEIADVRGKEAEYSLEAQGCCFPAKTIDFTEFDDERAIRTVAYPRIEAFAREMTGLEHIFAFDHGIRRRKHGLDSAGTPRAGGTERNIADFAHNDYTPISAELRVRWNLPDRAGELLQRRFAIFNVWWPIHGPLRDHPLALCHNAADDDFIEIENIFERGPNPILGLTCNAAHRWIYKSALQENEPLMFRTWDSDRPLSATVPHVAFADPQAGEDVLPRASIEMRVLAFYP